MSSAEERGLLWSIEQYPQDPRPRLIYADWLDDHGRPYRAMMQRVEASVSQVRYKIRRKSDGKFSEGGEHDVQWTSRGKEWTEFSKVRAYLALVSRQRRYGGNTDWSDVEVAVFEIRVQFVEAIPFTIDREAWRSRGRRLTMAEPE